MAQTHSLERHLFIEKCIGCGTFSAVYEARHLKTDKKFALKKVFIEEITDDKVKTDCKNEVYLLKRLRHPNIIRYFGCEFDHSTGILNVLLELATNGDLSHFISDHVKRIELIQEKTIWKFIIQLSSAIDFMHTNGIMHRDLKPANILLSHKGQIKICDFGLGKYIPIDSELHCSEVLGSPYYMSPERLLQMKYYFNSDIWSLGCITYEQLAALQSPFYVNKLDINLLIKRVVKCDYPPLPSDAYSKELQDVISMCTVVDFKKRPTAKNILDFVNQFYSRQYFVE